MDLNDVILTASESATLAAKHLEKHKCLDTFGRERDKAQCLKLLEWMNESCKSHISKRISIGVSGYMQRKDCRYCQVWIDNLLKGAK